MASLPEKRDTPLSIGTGNLSGHSDTEHLSPFCGLCRISGGTRFQIDPPGICDGAVLFDATFGT